MPGKKQKNNPFNADTDVPFDDIVKSLLDVPRKNITPKKSTPPKPKKRKK